MLKPQDIINKYCLYPKVEGAMKLVQTVMY